MKLKDPCKICIVRPTCKYKNTTDYSQCKILKKYILVLGNIHFIAFILLMGLASCAIFTGNKYAYIASGILLLFFLYLAQYHSDHFNDNDP